VSPPTALTSKQPDCPTPASSFAPALLITGDDLAACDGHLARVTGTIKPSDVIDEFPVRNLVEFVWEVLLPKSIECFAIHDLPQNTVPYP
jgi:hypothetical protein